VKKILAADLFCGAGGASTGFIRACELLGIDYELLAINHWQTAVDTHSANYPHVKHLCESVERVDPVVAVPGGRLHLLLAGPECTHFSTARGGRPVNPQSRASAWHILKWAQELYIDTILIENVPEFRTWGPVGTNGKPLQSKKGETYRAFLVALKSLGYKVEDRILNSADYGDPTTRRRLFIMARRGRHQVAWPTPTHSKTGSPTLFGKTKRWRAAREVIDWSVRGKSIFNRKKPLKPATIARILAGLEKFGGDALKPFLVILRNNQSAMSIDGPIPTLTTSGANVGLAQPFLMHITHGDAIRTARGQSIEPVPTVTCAKRGEIGVVESFVLPQHGGGALRPTGQPLPTIATDGAIAVVEPFIVPPLRFDPNAWSPSTSRSRRSRQLVAVCSASRSRSSSRTTPSALKRSMRAHAASTNRCRPSPRPAAARSASSNRSWRSTTAAVTAISTRDARSPFLERPCRYRHDKGPLRARRAVHLRQPHAQRAEVDRRADPAALHAATTSRSSSRSSTATSSTSTSGCCSRTSSPRRRPSRSPTSSPARAKTS
jgi:site-specific DNA-cytosine methylase